MTTRDKITGAALVGAILLAGIMAIQPSDDYVIPDNVALVDGNGSYSHIEAGDRLLIPSGRTRPLVFANLHGDEGNPITIINSDGQVRLDGNGIITIHLKNSEHLRLTGTGDAEFEYGFVIHDTGVCGITTNTDDGSRHIEIDHVEIFDTDGAAICAGKSQTYDRGEWTGRGYHFHHNYIHDIGTEGIYLGDSHWSNGNNPEVEGVDISYNVVERCSWDGIQVGSAVADVRIHHNYLEDNGLSTSSHGGNTRNGLVINEGTTGDFYNNWIIRAANRGILLLGRGDYRIYNNLIVDAGQLDGDGDGIRWYVGNNGLIYNNTVVNTRGEGIKASSRRTGAIFDNIVVESSQANIVKGGTSAYNNITSDPGFIGPDDYHLRVDSPAVDAGSNGNVLAYDLDDVARDMPDIGAYEYQSPIPDPTDTPLPSTSTSVPPTETSIPPTETPMPPTATPEPSWQDELIPTLDHLVDEIEDIKMWIGEQ